MNIRYPAPLRPGSRVVVLAPSSGVEAPLHPRLNLALAHFLAQGFVVEEGRSLRLQSASASAPAAERAAELMQTLQRDDVDAIFPPWGGELAIELLDRLDWPALARAKPKWCIGYSDTSTWQLPLTLRLGWATAHGPGLMDLVEGQSDPLTAQVLNHLALPAGASFEQQASTHWQKTWGDFVAEPACTYRLTEPTRWRCMTGQAAVRLEGRLIGGCLDTLLHLAGSGFGDVPAFVRQAGSEGALLYLENAELSPTAFVRAFHHLRWAGWLDGLAGVLLGRSAAPDSTGDDELRMEQALRATVATLPCPVLVDVDIGHRPPQLLLINGARARVVWSGAEPGRFVQVLA
jgi:muramoyltetrapeptide carboxypeptidase